MSFLAYWGEVIFLVIALHPGHVKDLTNAVT